MMFEQYLQSLPPPIAVYALPTIVIISGFLLGILCERIVFKALSRFATKQKWAGDGKIIRSFKGLILLWIMCAAFYYAFHLLPINEAQVILSRQILAVVLIGSFTILAARVAVALVNLYSSRIKGIFVSTTIFANITKGVIMIVGLLIALQTLGISIAPILATLGVGGLAVALALQDSLSNLFAGLHIIASSRIKPGDFIRIESGEEGYVEDITWRNTTIRALSKYLIIIPNSKLASSIVRNYSQTGKELTVMAEVTISYYNDLEKVEKVTLEVAEEIMKSVPGGVPEFKPYVRYNYFADNNIKFNVMMRGKKVIDQYLLRHEFLKKLHRRYVLEGISCTSAPKPPP